jgi:hypothetical protein
MSIEINGITIILDTTTPFGDPVPPSYYEEIIEYECFYRSVPTLKRCPILYEYEYEITIRNHVVKQFIYLRNIYLDNHVFILDNYIPDYVYDYNDREEYDNGLFKYF